MNSTSAYKIRQETSSMHWSSMHKNASVRSTVAPKNKYLLLKWSFDIIFSLIMITTVLIWLLPLLAILIKIDSSGPVFFRQKRIGRNGRVFYCWKLRTMVPNDLADEQPATEEDRRITRMGRLLRNTNADEFPQFFNILLGDMSVVGPRPHMISDCIRYSFVVPSYAFRSLYRPGITGWAQVNGLHGPVEDHESIILRYYWDAQYIRKAHFLLDMRILFSTVKKGFHNLFVVLGLSCEY